MIEVRKGLWPKPDRVYAIGPDGSEIEITSFISYEEDVRALHPLWNGPRLIKIECADYRIICPDEEL